MPDSGPSCQSPSLSLPPPTLTSITTFLTQLITSWPPLHAMSLWPVCYLPCQGCSPHSSSSQPYSTTSPPLLGSLSYTILIPHLQPSSHPNSTYSTNFPLLSGGVLGVSLKFLYRLKAGPGSMYFLLLNSILPPPNPHYPGKGSEAIKRGI